MSKTTQRILILAISWPFFCCCADAQEGSVPLFLKIEFVSAGSIIQCEATGNGPVQDWSWEVGSYKEKGSSTIQFARPLNGYSRICVNAMTNEQVCRYCRAVKYEEDECLPDQGLQVSLDRIGKTLFFQFDREIYMAYVHMINSEGEEIYSGNLQRPFMELDISRLRPGTYSFRIIQPGLEDDVFEIRF